MNILATLIHRAEPAEPAAADAQPWPRGEPMLRHGAWLVGAALILEMGLLSMFWNHFPEVPSTVWTGIAALLMALSVWAWRRPAAAQAAFEHADQQHLLRHLREQEGLDGTEALAVDDDTAAALAATAVPHAGSYPMGSAAYASAGTPAVAQQDDAPLLGVGLGDAQITRWVMGFLLTYAGCAWLSMLFHGAQTPLRDDLLQTRWMELALGALFFHFGAAVAASDDWRGTAVAWLGAAAYAFWARELFSVAEIYNRLYEGGLITDYQHLGDGFAMLTLMLATRIRQPLHVVAFVAVSLVVMFTIPSRSAAIIGTLGLITVLFAASNPPARVGIVAVVVLALVGRAVLPLESLFAGTRFESLFVGTEDTSWTLREELLRQGLDVIANRPLLGWFGFEAEIYGEAGLYVHNALDVWAQAGIVPFGVFLAMWGVVLYRWWLLWGFDRGSALRALPLLLFALLSWAYARHVGYVMPFFCIGYCAFMTRRLPAGE